MPFCITREKLLPQAMAVTQLEKLVTATGELLLVVVPLPNWP